MMAAFQRQRCAAQQHLGGIPHGLGPRHTALYRAVRQRFHEHIGVGRAAAGHGAGRVDQVLRQVVQQAGS